MSGKRDSIWGAPAGLWAGPICALVRQDDLSELLDGCVSGARGYLVTIAGPRWVRRE